jgi:hypothetical protein
MICQASRRRPVVCARLYRIEAVKFAAIDACVQTDEGQGDLHFSKDERCPSPVDALAHECG